MKKCFVFLIATLLSCFGFSEEFMDITIDKAIKLALKNNYMYLISKEGVKRYKYRLNQNFNFLPTVTLEGARNLDEKLMELEMPPMLPGDEPMKISIDFTKDYEFKLTMQKGDAGYVRTPDNRPNKVIVKVTASTADGTDTQSGYNTGTATDTTTDSSYTTNTATYSSTNTSY